MDHWNELRTALMLARHGTVSAAATVLGVHRATVNRHIDLLEENFGAPLFQRHARGYSLTETGQQLLDVAARAEEMFNDLAGRSRARAGRLSGKLTISTVTGVSAQIMPALRAFREAHPAIQLEYIASSEFVRLEHGEAHVALRAGAKPQTPDYVVQLYGQARYALYASREYVERNGMPELPDFKGHQFVGKIDATSRRPYSRWMVKHVPKDCLALISGDAGVLANAIREGIGIGFLAEHAVRKDEDLIQVAPTCEEWIAPFWFVTHVDLHRTEKVQEFLKYARAYNQLSVSNGHEGHEP